MKKNDKSKISPFNFFLKLRLKKLYEFKIFFVKKLANLLFSCPFGCKNIFLLPDWEVKFARRCCHHILLPILTQNTRITIILMPCRDMCLCLHWTIESKYLYFQKVFNSWFQNQLFGHNLFITWFDITQFWIWI